MYKPFDGIKNEMKRSFTLAKRRNICLKLYSNKVSSGSLAVKDVARYKIIFNLPDIRNKWWERKLEAGFYQMIISNVTGGEIRNIIIDENCSGLIIKLLKSMEC